MAHISKNKQNYLKKMKKKFPKSREKKKLRLKIMQGYKYPLENRT